MDSEDLKDTFTGIHVLGRIFLKLSEKVFDGDFANRRRLLSHFFQLLRLFLRRIEEIRQVVFIREPETGEKIRKGSNVESIVNGKPGKDGIEMVYLEFSSSFGIRSDPKSHRDKNRTEQIRRESLFRAKSRIAVLHERIHFRKVKASSFPIIPHI